ncbi:hypothetical protein C7S20_08930 [Christiangramia fulva]|uniref:Uncharacterized protein n=1 Tax=Christiangramia fulva TaxID=2126553 RepID=A0A2R3Z527_9FLAO|nr:hypothetical protein C7S20_08930 [Christiangramia fulva]
MNMTKLFRNIRKSLLTKGKTISYLKYGIGEIVLVVIWILIPENLAQLCPPAPKGGSTHL